MKRSPVGFVAKCQCGVSVGAIDYLNCDRKEAGQILGVWVRDGMTIEPRFESSWVETIKSCRCDSESVKKGCSLPDFLFQSHEVYAELGNQAKTRTSKENVDDVLDAVVRLLVKIKK